MGDFVGKEEVERMRAHYRAYMLDEAMDKGDNRAHPASGLYDASTFREVSSWYVNRLLRYIEVMKMIDDLEQEGRKMNADAALASLDSPELVDMVAMTIYLEADGMGAEDSEERLAVMGPDDGTRKTWARDDYRAAAKAVLRVVKAAQVAAFGT